MAGWRAWLGKRLGICVVSLAFALAACGGQVDEDSFRSTVSTPLGADQALGCADSAEVAADATDTSVAQNPLDAAGIAVRTLPLVKWDRLELEGEGVVGIFGAEERVGRVHLVRVGGGWTVDRIQWCTSAQPQGEPQELPTPG